MVLGTFMGMVRSAFITSSIEPSPAFESVRRCGTVARLGRLRPANNTRTKENIMKTRVLILIAAFALAGCASTSQLDQLKSRVDALEQTANSAKEAAAGAMSQISAANQAASNAQSTAQRALDAANSATERANRIAETCCSRK
jgi:murein lipoprotein